MDSYRNGEKCKFTHGKDELREPTPSSPPKWRNRITEEEEEGSSGNWDVEDDPKLAAEDHMKQSPSDFSPKNKCPSPPSTNKAFQEEWICSDCLAPNDGRLIKSDNCYRCDAYKYGLARWRSRKWICPRNGCGFYNDSTRMKCLKCNTPKDSGDADTEKNI